MGKTSYPSVSIIIPIRNEADFIERSLGAVLAQDYPADRMEILVVDGMSTDGTRDLIKALDKDHPDIPVTILNNPEQIVPPAMNIGIREAQGDIIVRVDGHCELSPRLREHLCALPADHGRRQRGRHAVPRGQWLHERGHRRGDEHAALYRQRLLPLRRGAPLRRHRLSRRLSQGRA